MGYLKSCVIAFTALFLFCTSCGEDITLTSTTSISPEQITEIFTKEVKGHIVDEQNVAVEGASIIINGSQTLTDLNGYFSINDLFLNDVGSLVSIEKEGYYTGYKLVYPPEAGSNFIKVQLIEKTLSATFNATEGFASDFENNANLIFEANSIQTSSGQLYEGDVNVYTHWYRPNDPALPLTMPGDLRAVNEDNQFVQLASYGMMAVELESPSGESLDLMPGKTASLQFPIPAELRANAPSVIQTWSYDENTGSWVEEGEARREGDSYIAVVSHFSFWNCDAPFPITELRGKFEYEGNIPFANYVVKIEVENDATIARSGWTNSDGVFKGKVPQDQALIIELVNDCEEVIYRDNLGSLAEATDLGTILISNIPEVITVTGSIVDCDANPIPDGYVIFSGVEFNALDFFAEDGTFTKIINICNLSSLSIKGFDIQNLKESEEVIVDLSQTNSSVDLGALAVCDIQIESFIRFEIENFEEVFIFDPSLTFQNNEYILIGSTRSDSSDFSKNIEIRFDNLEPTAQTPNRLNVEIFDLERFGFFACIPDCADVTLEITNSTSTVVEGTFTGIIEEYESNNPGPRMITGTFVVPNI